MQPAALSLSNVTKRFGETVAVRDLSLEVRRGEMFGLIGPDGAGKTTTIRLLCGLLRADAGSVRAMGRDPVREHIAITKSVGYFSQRFSLYGDLSIDENIAFFAEIHGLKRYGERRTRLLDMMQLTPFRGRLAERLSGGMKQKLALACTLVHEPEVILLDEPTTGVDPVSRRELWRLLSQVVARGVTVLMSTPYMDEAERCHTVGILYGGRLLTSGPPTQLEAQLPFHVIEVRGRPRGRTREVVARAKDVLSWRPVGDRLRLTVADPAATQAELARALEGAGAAVSILRQAKPTMEDVFVHLADQKRGEA